jgi:hypothetical protein F3_00797|uniref:DUF1351 domain-containing protein n=1 Tax=Podoviridae sp. ctxOS2 TaxID=2826590 RepID=A0A8S5MAW4_9CAUD|nr:MAG TPA: Protein of unknown function (DUF1351) [Podoviridae sp. ctxOS2]DAI19022.1 MAG TPA: Protein of unknown function (DUF1351) [Caudoviricetes sp.]DAI38776.1 MAG TPA: Protein of unknown function (DUF1351) [Caudoviricetes sp.]DAR12231.1 MAG TPA: Protein of unknown function (DUF1351) [Caudoviricetes sp.]DAR15556.1 MAG TPA: Protein of unknown function (DUF1351) [Caudoviricetes sp.]
MEAVDVIVQPAIEPQVIDSNLTMTWNNAELAKYLEEKLEKYNGLVVTEDNLKEMKSVLKEIVSIRTKLTRFGTDKKRELKIPYNTFTAELEQVLAVVSRVENPIANQIGEFEQQEMMKRKETVLKMVEDKAHSLGIREEYKNRVMPNHKWWENKTAKMSDVALSVEEMLKGVLEQQQNDDDLKRMQAEKVEMIKMKIDLFNQNYALDTPIQYEEIQHCVDNVPFGELDSVIAAEFEKRLEIELKAKKPQEPVERVIEQDTALEVTPFVDETETVTYVVKNINARQRKAINDLLIKLGVEWSEI